MTAFRPLLFCAAVALALPAQAQPRQARVPEQPPPAPVPAMAPGEKIVAVVNGDVITNGDVENRGRLFALSTGLPVTPEVLDRLRPQVTRQLIDERLASAGSAAPEDRGERPRHRRRHRRDRGTQWHAKGRAQ